MIFYLKNSLYAVGMTVFLIAANGTPPSTPKKTQESPFWRNTSDSLSNTSSAAPSPFHSPDASQKNSASTTSTPLISGLTLGSPLGKRGNNEVDEQSPAKKLKVRASFSDLMLKSMGDIVRGDRNNVLEEIKESLNSASYEELKDYYIDFKKNAFGPGQDSHDSENYDNLVRMPIINAFFNAAKEKKLSTDFLELPLFSFEHFQKPDRSGGYHKENDSFPVKVLLKNPRTLVYGGLFAFNGRLKNQKFSSFVPKSMSMTDVAQQVHQAYANRKIKKGNKIIGKSISGIDWEMYADNNSIELNSVFPLIAYADATKETQLSLDIADSSLNFRNYTFSQQDLIAFARKQNRLAEYEGQAFKIIDIASVLPGSDSHARSVYVKVLKSDL